MHFPAAHVEKSIPALRRLIHQNSLGVLTTAISSPNFPLLQVSHIPWVLDVSDESSETELGKLRGHMARQNPQSKAMIESSGEGAQGARKLEQEVLVVFTAREQHYVTPKFYVETKPDTGKVVPTWNYAAVQAYGKATIYFDISSPETSTYLDQQIRDLSKHAETSVMNYTGQGDRPGPWQVKDAPERYVEILKKNIIGVEIEIERLEGKFKMSQEERMGDRVGVMKGFEEMETEVGDGMGRLVRERSEIREARRTVA